MRDPSLFLRWAEALRARLRPLEDEEVQALAAGVVDSDDLVNSRTGLPYRGGIYCMRAFGSAYEDECLCSKYRRPEHRGLVCERCGVGVGPRSLRRQRFGALRLAVPARHPLFPERVVRSWLVLPAGLREPEDAWPSRAWPEPAETKPAWGAPARGLNHRYHELVRRALDAAQCAKHEAPAMLLEEESRGLEAALARVAGLPLVAPREEHLLGRLFRCWDADEAPAPGSEADALLAALHARLS